MVSGYRVSIGEGADLVEAILHAEYRAYLCMMSDHGCDCVALDFDHWLTVWVADR